MWMVLHQAMHLVRHERRNLQNRSINRLCSTLVLSCWLAPWAGAPRCTHCARIGHSALQSHDDDDSLRVLCSQLLDDAAVAVLASGLGACPSLHALRLRDCGISSAGLARVAAHLPPGLTALDVGGAVLGGSSGAIDPDGSASERDRAGEALLVPCTPWFCLRCARPARHHAHSASSAGHTLLQHAGQSSGRSLSSLPVIFLQADGSSSFNGRSTPKE